MCIRDRIKVEGQTETVQSWKLLWDEVDDAAPSARPRPQVKAKPEVAPITVIHEGDDFTKTYKITDTDSYFRASGEILNLSPEQIEHASKISRPIIKALADSFGIDEATYIQGLIPAIREVPQEGQPFAARVLHGRNQSEIAEGMGDALMDGVFRRSASLIEFVRTNPALTNDADSVITIQHELAHIVLADIFRLVSNGKGGQFGTVENLAESLKAQVLVRAELTGEAITSEQRRLLNDSVSYTHLTLPTSDLV